MKRHSIFFLLGVLLMAAAPARAWWPDEPYCTFIKDIQLDRTWSMNTNITDNDAGGWQSTISPTQEAPGYMCFAVVSWDNYKGGTDDYEMDWCQLELYNKREHQWHQICYLDFLPENNDGNSWSDNYNHEGHYNITSDPNLYKNMNGCETRYVKKRLYRDWADGIMFCFFNIKYSDATRRFIETAGPDLQIYLKGRWDDSHWRDFERYTDWRPGAFISRPSTPTDASMENFVEKNGKTVLRLQAPGVGNYANTVWMQYIHNGQIVKKEALTRAEAFDYDLATDFIDTYDKLHNGEYSFSFYREKNYPQNRGGYHSEANRITPETVYWPGNSQTIQAPQMRLARNLQLTNNGDGTITLNWQTDPVSSGRSCSEVQWIVERCTDGKFSPDNTHSVEVPYDKTKSAASYTDPFPDREKGEITYYYRVRRAHAITANDKFVTASHIAVQTNRASLLSFTCEASQDAGTVRAQWVLNAGIWTTGDGGMRIGLWQDGNELTSAQQTDYKAVNEYLVRNVAQCVKHTYEVRIMEGSNLRSSKEEKDFVLPSSAPSRISRFSPSKGFFNDRVSLHWSVDQAAQNFTTFELQRRLYGSQDEYRPVSASVRMTGGVLDYTYNDATVVPGTLYEYQLVGKSTCDDSTRTVAAISGVGFAQPYGVVTGQVLFENGQAVQDVTIDMSGDDTAEGASLELRPQGYARLDNPQGIFSAVEGSIELLIKPRPGVSDYHPVLYQENAMEVGITGDNQLLFRAWGTAAAQQLFPLDSSVQWVEEGFNHLAVTFLKAGAQTTATLYVNGLKLGEQTFNNQGSQLFTSANTLYIGFSPHGNVGNPSALTDSYFNGYMEDLRLWDACRTEAQIRTQHDCLLTGRETNLTGYYHFDRILEDKAIDISGDGSTFNERHLDVVKCVCNPAQLPTTAQLGLRARTDENGNYLLNAVPYTKNGSLYKLMASLGVHQFSPATKTLFFDQSASTHNNIDFTDISSFTVSGEVVYAGGDFPAEGIMFKVDGKAQSDNKGNPIQTDSKGHFSLSVPVGIHQVQAFCDGHRLTNDGWITNTDGSPINYQSDLSSVRFADSTRVRYVGRMCGGLAQKGLPVGHGVSKNNLGKGAYVYLEHLQGGVYRLSKTTRRETLFHQSPSIYALDSLNTQRQDPHHCNEVEYDENGIRIYVNDTTGEFYADVFPIQYTLVLSAPEYNNKLFEEDGQTVSFVGMSEKTNTAMEPRMYTDSVITRIVGDSAIFSAPKQFTDTVRYSKKQVFCLRQAPIFHFTQVDAQGIDLPYYGVDSSLVKVGDQAFMLHAYTPNDTIAYSLHRPLFTTDFGYTFRANVCEIYPYYQDKNTILRYDTVPVSDAVVDIVNTMTSPERTRLSIDSTGVAYYSFRLREPDMATAAGQLSAVARYNDNKSTINWYPAFGVDGRTYMTGTHKKGADFITSGPNRLVTILRDPAGSGSYSYLEEGATFKQNQSFSWDIVENGKLGLQLSFGVDFDIFTGMGVYIHQMDKACNTVQSGWQHDHTWTRNKSMESTITTTKRFSTSSSEAFVGPDADVFVGYATNHSMATAETVQLVDSSSYRRGGVAKYPITYAATPDSAFFLVKGTGISMGEQFATEFVYTQSDIEKEEIPRLWRVIDQLIAPYSQQDSLAQVNKANQTKDLCYMLRPGYSKQHADYGKRTSYYIIMPDSAIMAQDPALFHRDSVAAVMNWINEWKYYLGLNEYQKWKAIDKKRNLVSNYSIADGSTLTINNTYNTSLSYTYSRKTGDYFFIKNGTTEQTSALAYAAVDLVFEETTGTVATRSQTATQSYNHTCGFVLAPGANERLSIDVLHDNDWSEKKETNRPEWKDGGKGDAGSDKVDNVKGAIKQPDSYPSFIFSTRGGQTCCPYEPEVHPKYLTHFLEMSIEAERDSVKRKQLQDELETVRSKGNDLLLSASTLQTDKPSITALNTYLDGVPSGEEAFVKISMANGSDSGTDRPFWLILKEGSNPNGAQLTIDGTGLGTGATGGSGVSYLIPYGTTLEKTIAVRKGSVLNYDNITLYLASYCGTITNKLAIKDSCSFSVHFTPACSAISIKNPSNNWVYNTRLDSAVNPLTQKKEMYLPIELNNFDVNYDEFDHIELQYKPSSDSEARWKKIRYFYKDSTSLKAAIAADGEPQLRAVCTGGVIRYEFFMDDMQDQQYDLRAVTVCRNGNERIYNYSDVVSGIKDTYNPRLFGTAQPANGILTLENEVRLDFNEDIAGGKLTYNNFSVVGVLDEDRSDRQIAVHLSGDGRMETEATLHLGQDYTLEGFFRQTNEQGEQQLFCLGRAPYQVALSLNAQNDRLIVSVDSFSITYPLNGAWQKEQWNHVAVRREERTNGILLSVAVNFTDLVGTPAQVKITRPIEGRLKVGNGFIGDVDQVRLWSAVRRNDQLRELANTHISNTSISLLCCYNINENEGILLEDIAGGHTMIVHSGTWVVPAGRALHLQEGNFATIPLSEHSLTADHDFTLSFWFRTAEKKECILLTTDTAASTWTKNDLSIGLTQYGQVCVRSTGGAYISSNNYTNYADNQWHNVIFSVGRSNGFARLFIDGNIAASVTQDKVQGLAGSQLYLGGKYTGEIDEIKLFNMYVTQYQVEHFHMQKTDSAAIGLAFYYPMERYETSAIGVSSLEYSLKNFCKDSQDEMTVQGATESRESAPVATASHITRLDQTGFTFTPNDQSIIITLTKPLARLEHTILTFTAERVADVHGNQMLSPVTWSAYIDRNPLVVEETDIHLETGVNEPLSHSLIITNRSGAYHHYSFSGVPGWLELNEESGTIAPKESLTIHFSASESLAIGTHTAHLYLVNSDDVVIPITITVVVTGEEPDFEFDPSQYRFTMNIVGQLCIDGIYSTDTRDVLAVYSGKKCVGKANTTYYKDQDAYYVNLTVYSDSTTGRPLTYLIYDASTGRSYAADCKGSVHTFQNNAIIGSPADPAVFYNSGRENHTYNLQQGWNWVSWNTKVSGGNTPDNVLGKDWPSGAQVKTFDASVFFDYKAKDKAWSASRTMDSTKLWVVYSSEPRQLIVTGEPVHSDEAFIKVVNGWNGIAYLPTVNMSLKEAFSGFYDVRNNDVVKSQTQFAIFFNGDWVGTLKTMRPGEGYMLKHVGDECSFHYPATSISASQAPRRAPVLHATTMSLVARPEGLSVSEGDVLTAYAGDEVVGAAELQDGVWYLSVAGDYGHTPLRFVCHSMQGSAVSTTAVSYSADAVIGSPESPIPLEFSLQQDGGVEKRLRDEQVIIIRDGHIFNALGIRLQ